MRLAHNLSSNRSHAALLSSLLVAAPCLAAGDPPDAAALAAAEEGAYDELLLGDAFGARKTLEDLGLSVSVLATLDLSASSGGVERMQTGLYYIDVALEWDLAKLELVDGGVVFFDFVYSNSFGDSPSSVGSYWGWDVINSGLDAELLQVSELWWQQRIGDSGFTARLGKIDANRFFALPVADLAFVNSAAYLPATTLSTMPTYPNPAMGAMIEWDLGTWFTQAGVFDGSNAAYNPNLDENGPRTGGLGFQGLFDGHDGPYLIAETGPAWQCGGEGGWEGSARLGGWMQVGESQLSTDAGTTIVDDPAGLYLTLKQSLHAPLETGTRFSLFGQAGWSDPAKVAAEWSAMAGVVCDSPFSARPNDSAGLLLSHMRFSDDPLVYTSPVSATSGGGETAVEIFYRFDLGRGVAIQPDLQWIGTPGGGDPSDVDDAWIATLRLQIAF